MRCRNMPQPPHTISVACRGKAPRLECIRSCHKNVPSDAAFIVVPRVPAIELCKTPQRSPHLNLQPPQPPPSTNMLTAQPYSCGKERNSAYHTIP